jgi:hypothetical protein
VVLTGDQWRTGGVGFGVFNHAKFQSFVEAVSISKFGGLFIQNNLIEIWYYLFAK